MSVLIQYYRKEEMNGMSFESGKPLYQQLCDGICVDILNGVYSPGDKLPGVRELALRMGVNPNTMQRALGELEAKELIVTRGTSGKFVTEDPGIIEKTKADMIGAIVAEYKHKLQTIGVSPEDALNLLLKNKEGQ